MEFRKRDPDQIWVWEITYGFSLNRGRGREAIETDVSIIGVMTSLWCALLPTQASEVAAQIWEVQLFCRSNFKKAWEVHLYADLTETLYKCRGHCRLRIQRCDRKVDGQFISYSCISEPVWYIVKRVIFWWIVLFGWEMSSDWAHIWQEPYGLVDICSTIRREGLEFGNMENERYNGSVQSWENENLSSSG